MLVLYMSLITDIINGKPILLKYSSLKLCMILCNTLCIFGWNCVWNIPYHYQCSVNICSSCFEKETIQNVSHSLGYVLLYYSKILLKFDQFYFAIRKSGFIYIALLLGEEFYVCMLLIVMFDTFLCNIHIFWMAL